MGYSIVLVSLSPANQGLTFCHTPEQSEEVEKNFIEGLQMLSFLLRGMMSPGARLIFGGPYPNDGYSEIHLQVLIRTLDAIRSFEEVDHVIDFLQPAVHCGNGRWVQGLSNEERNPNEMGHAGMFKCVNLTAVLGLP